MVKQSHYCRALSFRDSLKMWVLWGAVIKGALRAEQVGNHRGGVVRGCNQAWLPDHRISKPPSGARVCVGSRGPGQGTQGGQAGLRGPSQRHSSQRQGFNLPPKSLAFEGRSTWLTQTFDSQFPLFVAMTSTPRLLDY